MPPLTDQRHPSLSIVIPLFNEEENVPLLLAGIFAELGHDPDFLELVLVDDGSRDRTVQMIQQAMISEPRIRLAQHEKNRGLGAGIRTGLVAAAGELILYTDADLPFEFNLIPALLALSTPDNIVIGCRNNRGEGGRRWLLSKGYNLMTRLALGVRVRDVNFACKLMTRKAVRGMNLKSEGSFIDAEILLECRRQGFQITEMPMTYYPRTLGQSTLSRPGVIFGIMLEMFRYFLRPTIPINYELAEETDHQR